MARSPLRTSVALALALLFVAATSPSPGRAAAHSFGTPTAAASYGVGVEFRQPFEGRDVAGIEIVIEFGDEPIPYVVRVPAPARTPPVLEYTLDLATGGAAPNTRLSARWRVTFDDGSVAVGPNVGVTYADTRFEWRTRGTGDVRVHWYEGTDVFGRRALEIAERGVADAASLFGVTIEEPIDFFIYASEAAFYEAMGPSLRENVGGVAMPEIRTLFAYVGPDEIDGSFAGTAIPHELTHLVFDTAVDNPYHAPPKWLNEGIATYLSEGFTRSRRADVREAVTAAAVMPLSALVGQFPTTRERFSLAYSEATSAMDFLVRTHGREAIVALVAAYAEGLTDDAAFRAATGLDVAGFEAAWLADLGAATPEAFGPQPAPAGPVPSDWIGPGATPGTVPGTSASPAPSEDPSPSPQPSGAGSGGGGDGVAIGVLVAVVVIAIGGSWLLRRRRPGAGAES